MLKTLDVENQMVRVGGSNPDLSEQLPGAVQKLTY